MANPISFFIVAVVFATFTMQASAQIGGGSINNTGDPPEFTLDCPFFLKWSADWGMCIIQLNTIYGLTIMLGIVVTVVIVVAAMIWKIYGSSATRSKRS